MFNLSKISTGRGSVARMGYSGKAVLRVASPIQIFINLFFTAQNIGVS